MAHSFFGLLGGIKTIQPSVFHAKCPHYLNCIKQKSRGIFVPLHPLCIICLNQDIIRGPSAMTGTTASRSLSVTCQAACAVSYWIVNTIRYRLKQASENCYWTEIARRMSTQKAVTTEATNALGEKVHMRMCSEPTEAANNIYELLKYKKMPFRKIKIQKRL